MNIAGKELNHIQIQIDSLVKKRKDLLGDWWTEHIKSGSDYPLIDRYQDAILDRDNQDDPEGVDDLIESGFGCDVEVYRSMKHIMAVHIADRHTDDHEPCLDVIILTDTGVIRFAAMWLSSEGLEAFTLASHGINISRIKEFVLPQAAIE